MEKEGKYALLIDADNISPKYIDIILSESKEFGAVSIRRIYGDWTDNSKSTWKKVLLENSITPIQQYNYSTGKNSSDSAMIIDAMDILYGNDIDGFILVSSDSDFTRLAMRLREAGKDIIGMGESKTPTAFVKACQVFKTLDVLHRATSKKSKKTAQGVVQAVVEDVAADVVYDVVYDVVEQEAAHEEVVPITSIEVLRSTILDLVDSKGDDEGWLFLGELGNFLLKEYPDFDCRNYGYKKLAELIKDCDQLEMKNQKAKNGRISLVYARRKE